MPRALNKLNVFLLFASYLAFVNLAYGQQSEHHNLTAFHGTIYQMPEYSETKGFTNGLANFDSIDQIVLLRLNFRPEYPNLHFPEYQLKDRFAFALRATLDIKTDSCYRITLASDDGSKLWIDETLSVDNGGMHKWKIARDTLNLNRGQYDLRLWYYNAVGPCGLAFRVDATDPDFCREPAVERLLCLSFAENEHRLGAEHKALLQQTIGSWNLTEGQRLSVTGYADSLGNSQYNVDLSLRRSESVRDFLNQELGVRRKQLAVTGKGEVAALRVLAEGCASARAVVVRRVGF